MPNAFAYLMLFAWPIIAAVLFRVLPLQKALVWTMLGGYLLLPAATSVKFPMLPAIDKAMVPSLTALILCMIHAPKSTLAPGNSGRIGRIVTISLLVMMIGAPVITVLLNPEPVAAGPFFISGLRLYDAFSMISAILVSIVPFWIGLRYLNDREGHRILLQAFVVGALAYSVPALLEARLSPQLHTWIYGFFQHDFIQHIRAGGFRPIVFLNHGLMIGILFCSSLIAALVLWREGLREGKAASGWIFAAIWLMLILVVSKNFGALSIAVFLAPFAIFAGRRVQTACAIVIATVIVLFPMLRGAGLIPVDAVYDFALSINAERADSLLFRFRNEDLLLAHANDKALFGWGSWGRNLLYEEGTGRIRTIADGAWIIIIGTFGWVGYIANFGLLTVPILFYFLKRNQFGPSLVTPGLILVLCVTLIDLIPNAGLVAYVWLMAGGLAGYVLWRPVEAPEGPTSVKVQAEAGRQGSASLEPPKWVMATTGPSQRKPRTARRQGLE